MTTPASEGDSSARLQCVRLVHAPPDPRTGPAWAQVIELRGREFFVRTEPFASGGDPGLSAAAAEQALFVGLQVLGPGESNDQPSVLAEVPGEQLLSRAHVSQSVSSFELLPTRYAVRGVDPNLDPNRDPNLKPRRLMRSAVDLWVRIPSFLLRLHRGQTARTDEGLDGDFAWLSVRLRVDSRLRLRVHLGLAAGSATDSFLWIKGSQWWELGVESGWEALEALKQPAWFEASAKQLGIPTGRSDLRSAAEQVLGLRTELKRETLRHSRTPLLAYWTRAVPGNDSAPLQLRFWRCFGCGPEAVDPFLSTDSLGSDGTPVVVGLEQRPRRLSEIVEGIEGLPRRWAVHVVSADPPVKTAKIPPTQPGHSPELEKEGFQNLFSRGWAGLMRTWSPNAPQHRTALFDVVPSATAATDELTRFFPVYSLSTTLHPLASSDGQSAGKPSEDRVRILFRVEPGLPFPAGTEALASWTLRFGALRDHRGRPATARALIRCRTPGISSEGAARSGEPFGLEVADLEFADHPTLRMGAMDLVLGSPGAGQRGRWAPCQFWFRRQAGGRGSPSVRTEHILAPLELEHFALGEPGTDGVRAEGIDAGLAFAVLEVLPGETDRLEGPTEFVRDDKPSDPESVVKLADRWPLLLPLGSWSLPRREGRFLLRITEVAGRTRPQTFTLRLLKMEGERLPRDTRLRVFYLDRAPFFVGLLDLPPLSEFDPRQGNELAIWSTEGPYRGWQLRISSFEFELRLPPQGIGEAMEKGRAEDGYEDVEPGDPVDFRFTPPTVLKLAGSDSERNYGNTPWNIRALLNAIDDKGRVGIPLREARFEMLYGLRFRLANVNHLRLAELLARLGTPRSELPVLPVSVEYRTDNETPSEAASRDYAFFRKGWEAMLRSVETRLGIYEVFDERQREFGPNSVPEGFTFHGPPGSDQLQAVLRKSAQLRTSLPEPYPNDQSPNGLPRIPASELREKLKLEGLEDREWWRNLLPNFEDGLAGSFAWAFESVNLYRMLWRDPNPETPRWVEAVEATITRLFFSALGGWCTQSATFADGRIVISVTVEMGRVSELRVEVIGRVARFWNRARMVTVFRRTVLPTRQFASQQDPHHGRPILRKTEEYIEFLDKSRLLCDELTQAVGAALPGALKACSCDEKILVDARWGTDVYDGEGSGAQGVGWKLPIRKAGAPSDIYGPANVLLAFHPGAPGARVEGRIANLADLWFWVDTRPGRTGDTKWPSIRGLDTVDEVLADPGNPESGSAQLLWATPPVPSQAIGATYHVVGLSAEANLTHHIAPGAPGSGENPSVGSFLKNVTLGRGGGEGGEAGGIIGALKVDPVVQFQRQVRAQTEHLFGALEQLTNPGSGEGAEKTGWERHIANAFGIPIPDPAQPTPAVFAALGDVLGPVFGPLQQAVDTLGEFQRRVLRQGAWLFDQTAADGFVATLGTRQKEIASAIHGLIRAPQTVPDLFQSLADRLRADLRAATAQGVTAVKNRLEAPLREAQRAYVDFQGRLESLRAILAGLSSTVPAVTAAWIDRLVSDLRRIADHSLDQIPDIVRGSIDVPQDPFALAIDRCVRAHLADVFLPANGLFTNPGQVAADIEAYGRSFSALAVVFFPGSDIGAAMAGFSGELTAVAETQAVQLRQSAEALARRWVRMARGSWNDWGSGPLGGEFLRNWRSRIEKARIAITALADLPESLVERWRSWIVQADADLGSLESSLREGAGRESEALEAMVAELVRQLTEASVPLAGLASRIAQHPVLAQHRDRIVNLFPADKALDKYEALVAVVKSRTDAWEATREALIRDGTGVLKHADLEQRARQLAGNLGDRAKAIGDDLCRKLSANVRRSFEQVSKEVLSLATRALEAVRVSVDQLRDSQFLEAIRRQDATRRAIAGRLRFVADDLAGSCAEILRGTEGTLEQAGAALDDLEKGIRQARAALDGTDWMFSSADWTQPVEKLRALAKRRVRAYQESLDRLLDLARLRWTRGLPGRLDLPVARAVLEEILDRIDEFTGGDPRDFGEQLTGTVAGLKSELAGSMDAFLRNGGPLAAVRAKLREVQTATSGSGPSVILTDQLPAQLRALAQAIEAVAFDPADITRRAAMLQGQMADLHEELARVLSEQGAKVAAQLSSDCGAGLLEIDPAGVAQQVTDAMLRQLGRLKDRIPKDLRNLERSADRLQRWADAQRDQLGSALDRLGSIAPTPIASDVTEAAQQAFRTFRAFGVAPAVPGLDFRDMGRLPDLGLGPEEALRFQGHLQNLGARLRNVSFAFRKEAEAFQLRMTPVRALVDRATSAAGGAIQSARLKAASLELQVRDIRRKLEADLDALKNKALKDLIPDLGGLKLERLLGAAGLSDSFLRRLKEKTTLRHGMDPQTLTAYVDCQVESINVEGSLTLFSLGPVSLLLRNVTLTTRIRIESQGGREAHKEAYGKLVADWEFIVGGQALMTYRQAALESRNGQVRMDLDPTKIRLASVLQYVSDLMKRVPQRDEGGLRVGLRENLPHEVVGFVKLNLDLPTLGGGTTTIQNLRLGLMLELGLHFPNFPSFRQSHLRISAGVNLAERDAPFIVSFFILGGCGWFTLRVDYLVPFRDGSPELRVYVNIALGVSASLALDIGFARGSVFVSLSLQAECEVARGRSTSTFSLILTIAGSLNILSIIDVSIVVTLGVRYSTGRPLEGFGRISVRIKICWCFTLKVDRSFTCRLGGGGNKQQAAVHPGRAASAPRLAKASPTLNGWLHHPGRRPEPVPLVRPALHQAVNRRASRGTV